MKLPRCGYFCGHEPLRGGSGPAGTGLQVLAGDGEVLGVDVGGGQPVVHLGAAAAHPDGLSGAEGEHGGD